MSVTQTRNLGLFPPTVFVLRDNFYAPALDAAKSSSTESCDPEAKDPQQKVQSTVSGGSPMSLDG